MKLYCDITRQRFVQSNRLSAEIEIILTQNDDAEIEVYLLIPSSHGGRYPYKYDANSGNAGITAYATLCNPGGTPLTLTAAVQLTAIKNGFAGTLNLDTEEIVTFLAGRSEREAFLAIEITDEDENDSAVFNGPVTLRMDSTTADTVSIAGYRRLQDVTGYTGGGPTNLDGAVPAGETVGTIYLVTIDDSESHWINQGPGAIPTDLDAGIILTTAGDNLRRLTLTMTQIAGLVAALDGKSDITEPIAATHVARTDNPHAVTKSQVNLSSVDNTSDANKPISSATQAALDGKAAVAEPIAATHAARTDNPHAVTKNQVGLGNTDNTSDAAKPVSTAAQTALDLKANDSAVVHNTGAEAVAGVKTFTSPVLVTPNIGAASGTSLSVTGALSGASSSLTGSQTIGAGNGLIWSGRSQFRSSADGIITATNNAQTDFNRLNLGGTSASFPALKRSSTTIVFRLADDSADAPVTAASFNKLTLTAPATSATLTIADGKTLTASNTLTLTGTDGSTLGIGTGGTLGSNAYTSTAYAPLASPTFTGTVTIPQEAWTDFTFANSWVNYGGGFQTAQYRKDAQGRVHLRGMIKDGTTTDATQICTALPAGYRPSSTVLYGVPYNNGAFSVVEIRISNSGNVTLFFATGTATYLSLNGISFSTN